ncbi:MAG: 2TM domain-containing protein [Algicola sp.]|nr:2TM domain-containing protein [Algicola sp.]
MKPYDIEPYRDAEDSHQEKFAREEAYRRAKEKVKKIVGFYWHLASYVIVNIFIITLIVINGGTLWSFATFSTAFFWGIGLLFHFLGVFGPDVFFGKNWEQRKIKEFMDKENKHWE